MYKVGDDMKPKISKTSKMQIRGKKVGSWSLPAGPSCPGSKDAEVCEGCYAKKGTYRFPSVKGVREFNREDYKTHDWVDRMIVEVNKFDYFRWFDSGDVESVTLAAKIKMVIEQTPYVRHWLPTRSDKIKTIGSVLGGIHPLKNAVLRPSADNIGFKDERDGVVSYVIRESDITEAFARGVVVCPVTAPGSTQKSCDDCTVCYTDASVAYLIH